MKINKNVPNVFESTKRDPRIFKQALQAGFSEEESDEIMEAFSIASEDERVIILDILGAPDIDQISEDPNDDNYEKKAKAVNRSSRKTLLTLVRKIIEN